MLQIWTKMEVAMQNGRLKFKNAAKFICKILQIPCNVRGSIFQMSQMLCKIRGSISTMQVDVAECWQYGKHHANSVFFLLGFAKFTGFVASPTATTTATAITTGNYYYNNCNCNYKNYSSYNYNCNKHNKTNNPQLTDNHQKPTTTCK